MVARLFLTSSLSKAECEKLAAELTSAGISATYYHSSALNRELSQRRWMNDELQVGR